MFSELMSMGWLSTAMVVLVIGLVGTLVIFITGIIRYIPNDRIGVIEKLWSSSGSVKSGLLALHGEAGFQPELRRGGFHFFAPLQYRVHIHPMVSVTQGKIGYVFAPRRHRFAGWPNPGREFHRRRFPRRARFPGRRRKRGRSARYCAKARTSSIRRCSW